MALFLFLPFILSSVPSNTKVVRKTTKIIFYAQLISFLSSNEYFVTFEVFNILSRCQYCILFTPVFFIWRPVKILLEAFQTSGIDGLCFNYNLGRLLVKRKKYILFICCIVIRLSSHYQINDHYDSY